MKVLSFAFLLVFFASCTVRPVEDHWHNLSGNQWEQTKKVIIPVDISDTGYYYNLSVNLRVTNDYKYSNLWLKLNSKDPNGKSRSDQVMLNLADHRGNWKGHNLGHIISFRIPVSQDIVFPHAGRYTYSIEQYMRDPVLKEVVSVGLLVEKQQEILK